MNQMTPFYMDRLLSDLVNGYGNRDSVVSQLRNRMKLPVTGMIYNVAVLRDDQFDEALLSKFRNRRHLLSFTLINICNELLMDQGLPFDISTSPGKS